MFLNFIIDIKYLWFYNKPVRECFDTLSTVYMYLNSKTSNSKLKIIY